jgi:hypothetical protein
MERRQPRYDQQVPITGGGATIVRHFVDDDPSTHDLREYGI